MNPKQTAEALAVFYRQYHTTLLERIVRYGVNLEDAEDLCQQFYLQCLQHDYEIDMGDKRIAHFIGLRAKRSAINYFRALRRRPEFVSINAVAHQLNSSSFSYPINIVNLIEKYSAIFPTIKNIAPVIIDRECGNMSIRQIAQRYRIRTATVCKYLLEWRRWVRAVRL